MSPANDPFYAGTPGDWTMARWFAQIWKDAGYTSGVHLRRIHYWAVSKQRLTYKGEPYQNTMKCWKELTQASKMARYLNLVRIEDIRDNKSPEPNITAWRSQTEVLYPEAKLINLDEIGFDLFGPNSIQAQPCLTEIPSPMKGKSMIQTSLGPKPGHALRVGDLVLTDSGLYRPVKRLIPHPYSGDLVSIRTRYSAHDVLLPPGQEVLTLRGKAYGKHIAKELSWVCADDIITRSDKGHYKGDYLALPRIQPTGAALPWIEPSLNVGGRADGRGGQRARPILPVEIDDRVAWMLGYFVGNGFAGKRGIVFTLHARAVHYREALIEIGRRFGINPTYSIYGNTAKVRYCSLRLIEWFKTQFAGQSNGRSHTGSRNKRIPHWMVTAPDSIASSFVQGLWDSDGTVHSEGHLSIATSSMALAETLRLMLARFGKLATVANIKKHGHYTIRWSSDEGARWTLGMALDDHLLLPIRTIARVPFDGVLYDIEIEGGSYVSQFLVRPHATTTHRMEIA